MIEFKSECGHTVRAKDQDAGKVVRCNYCGKAANVPDGAGVAGGGMDFLLGEIDRAGGDGAVATAAPKRKGRSLFSRRRRKEGEFDPFAFVLKLVYAAALVTVVFLVGKLFVLPLIRGEGPKAGADDPYALPPADSSAAQPNRPKRESQGASRTAGLRTLVAASGLFISSTPPGAEIYYMPEASAPASGERIADRKDALMTHAGAQIGDLVAGQYMIEVVFKWTDGSLNAYPVFREFREGIRSGNAAARARLMEEYFLPDEAVAAFVSQTEDQTFLVRQYVVDVRGGRWASVRSLFLPRIKATDGVGFAIGPVVRYLPEEKPYLFDEALVRRELDFYRVPPADRQFLVDMLRAVGVAPYASSDGRTQMFKIAVEDGSFGVKEIAAGRR